MTPEFWLNMMLHTTIVVSVLAIIFFMSESSMYSKLWQRLMDRYLQRFPQLERERQQKIWIRIRRDMRVKNRCLKQRMLGLVLLLVALTVIIAWYYRDRIDFQEWVLQNCVVLGIVFFVQIVFLLFFVPDMQIGEHEKHLTQVWNRAYTDRLH